MAPKTVAKPSSGKKVEKAKKEKKTRQPTEKQAASAAFWKGTTDRKSVVVLTNLPSGASDAVLKQFNPEATLVRKNGKKRSKAFLKLKNASAADALVKQVPVVQGLKITVRRINKRVHKRKVKKVKTVIFRRQRAKKMAKLTPKRKQRSPTRSPVFVLVFGNCPPSLKEDDLKNYYLGFWRAAVTSVKVVTDEKGKCKGNAFVYFASEAVMKAALKKPAPVVNGTTLLVGKAGKQGKKLEFFLGGVPETVKEDDIKGHYTKTLGKGSVLRVRLPVDKDGKRKSHAFVSVTSKELLEKALKAPTPVVKGATITVGKRNVGVRTGRSRGCKLVKP